MTLSFYLLFFRNKTELFITGYSWTTVFTSSAHKPGSHYTHSTRLEWPASGRKFSCCQQGPTSCQQTQKLFTMAVGEKNMKFQCTSANKTPVMNHSITERGRLSISL